MYVHNMYMSKERVTYASILCMGVEGVLHGCSISFSSFWVFSFERDEREEEREHSTQEMTMAWFCCCIFINTKNKSTQGRCLRRYNSRTWANLSLYSKIYWIDDTHRDDFFETCTKYESFLYKKSIAPYLNIYICFIYIYERMVR